MTLQDSTNRLYLRGPQRHRLSNSARSLPNEGAGFALSGSAILQTKQAVEASHNDETATPNRATFKFAITHKIIEGRPAQVAVCAGV